MTARVICCPHCGHEFRLEGEPEQRYAMREGTRFIVALQPGEQAVPHLAGGFIIAHPDHAPVWWREDEHGDILCTKLEPGEPGTCVPVEFVRSRSFG